MSIIKDKDDFLQTSNILFCKKKEKNKQKQVKNKFRRNQPYKSYY